MKTNFYKKKLSATATEQSLELPRLIEFHIINAGSDNCYIEPDNAIDSDSILLPAGMSVSFKGNYLKINYKAVSSTATLYLYGTRHFKE